MNKPELAQKVVNNSLNVDGLLKTLKKALEGEDNFDYSYVLEQASALNWSNHDTATDIQHEDYKLDRIRELLDK